MNEMEREMIDRRYQRAVRNLNPQAWSVMLPQEKLQDLQALENKNAMDQNRVPCRVQAEPMAPGQWAYQADSRIVVNANELDNPSFMEHVDSIYHEGSHARDMQAQYFPEVSRQYAPGQVEERNTPVPDPNTDLQGYLDHPAEVAARAAGAQGVAQTQADRTRICAADQTYRSEYSNQILETYDYDALADPEAGAESEIADEQENSLTSGEQAGVALGADLAPDDGESL